jgi:YVTN family beta-propeller protein
LSVASGQWLEKTVPLPDSFSGLRDPRAFAVNTGDNTVYVGGDGECLLVLDGVTHRKIARIPVPGHDHLLCYNPVLNKVYCTSGYSPYVYVIDAAANRLIDSVPVDSEPVDVCYAPGVDKVYCACRGVDSTIVVAIDCVADTVTGVDTLWGEPVRLCSAPAEGKLYCGIRSVDEDNVAVLDCVGDTLAGSVYVVDISMSDMVYSPMANKLYVSWGSFGELIIIDCARDSVLTWASIGSGGGQLAVCDRQNKVYVSCGSEGRIDVVSESANSVTDSITGLFSPGRLVLDTTDDVVFCTEGSRGLVAIDCSADTVLGRVPVGRYVYGVCWSPGNDCVYVGAGDVFVVNAPARQIVAQLPMPWFDIREVGWCARDNELYACSWDTIAVVDLATDRVRKFISVPDGISSLFYYAPGNKVYCDGPDVLNVLDCVTDSIVKTIPTPRGFGGFCYDVIDRKLYGRSRDGLTVVSCDADSVVAALVLGEHDVDDFVYSPVVNRLYCALEDSTVAVVDCAADTVVGELSARFDEYHTLCYIPDGDLVTCTSYRRDSVQVFSCATGQLLASVPVYYWSTLSAYSSRGKKLYCFTEMAPLVEVVDMQTLSRVGTIELSKYVKMTSYDTLADRLACVIDNPYEVAFIACASDSVVATIPVPGYPASIARGADRRLYVANQYASSFSVIRDTTTVGVRESRKPQATSFKPMATVVRGVLCLPEASSPKPQAASWLLDIAGRKVLDLKPGANDVSGLSPGVYFVRERSAVGDERSAIHRVVIAR